MRTVPAPVSIAPLPRRARRLHVVARSLKLLIHARPPDAGVVRASRLMASFNLHEGAAALEAREESDIELARLLRVHADRHGDSGGFQPRDPGAGDPRVRIDTAAHHPRHAGGDQGVRARWRSSRVTARFERDVHGGAPGLRTRGA